MKLERAKLEIKIILRIIIIKENFGWLKEAVLILYLAMIIKKAIQRVKVMSDLDMGSSINKFEENEISSIGE